MAKYTNAVVFNVDCCIAEKITSDFHVNTKAVER